MQFNLQLKHVSGKAMIQSDTLSRLQHLNLEDNDNNDMILLPDKLFISTVDMALNERIKDIHAKDQIVLDALAAAKQGNPLPMTSSLADWTFNDGLVFYKDRCYVPPDKDLRREIV